MKAFGSDAYYVGTQEIFLSLVVKKICKLLVFWGRNVCGAIGGYRVGEIF